MKELGLGFAISHLMVGTLIILVSVPLYLRQIGQNEIYGMRFRESHLSDEAWYAINRYGARWMIVWSLGLMAFGAYLFFAPVAVGSLMFWLAILAPLLLLVPAYQTWRFARRFAADAKRRDSGGSRQGEDPGTD